MENLVREVSNLTNEIIEAGWNVTPFEAMQIAVKIQHNDILKEAFMVRMATPGALECIAMELGANTSGSTIKSALIELADIAINKQ